MITTRKITRMQAVSNQLDSAYKTYFLWDDLVSAITLAGAAERVLSDMQPQDGIFGVDANSLRSLINLYVKPEHSKEVATLFRADYDFFRHADKKTQSDYEIKERAADFFLLFPLLSYEHLKQPKTHAMRAYAQWFFYRYPSVLKKENQDDGNFLANLLKAQEPMTKQQFYEMRCSFDLLP
jgi:hypothetical protein